MDGQRFLTGLTFSKLAGGGVSKPRGGGGAAAGEMARVLTALAEMVAQNHL